MAWRSVLHPARCFTSTVNFGWHHGWASIFYRVRLCSLAAGIHCPKFGKVRSVPKYPRMAPIPVWSGNLRLSLVLVPVRMFPATSKEGAIAFRMIHEPSGQPIKYLKGIETEDGFEEVPEEEIIKGYEHTKGHHVLIKPEELDELKLEAKHTIDMARFVDRNEIDSRYFEKPYYLLPDGDRRIEGYVVLRDALAKSKKLAIGQLIMHGRSTWSASPPKKEDLCC